LLDNSVILAPRTGTAALIYYQGLSEPETAQFLERVLIPGMTFFDLGAHVGEYSVLGARRVGPSGRVHAFEPEPTLASLIEKTLSQNKLFNTVVRRLAISDRLGVTKFVVRRELADSSIKISDTPEDGRASATITVQCTTLDQYCSLHAVHPQVIKADVEGAEILVLDGAKQLLGLPPSEAPIWILELSLETYARFGKHPRELCMKLSSAGYEVFELTEDSNLRPLRDLGISQTRNLVAIKQPLP
jgi:FkbM family methyltransferase